MRLYNTESGGIETLAAPSSTPLGIYVCGITPYDTTHLGHAFTYLAFDVLVRTLRSIGYRVRYVQNVTDVDDDILKRARELGTSWSALATTETRRYQRDMAALNVRPPDVFPWATEAIKEIIALVDTLRAQGRAYLRDGNVYFRVRSRPDYGRLSRLSRAEMITLSRERGADPDDPRKDDPLDFILWQRSEPDEPAWSSPWSEGRPGWHIECSAMALQHLGPTVDIHGGGADLIFPHHESEIAQSESVTGCPFVRTWMHVGMVRFEGQKMSKSLRNLVLVWDLLQRFDADTIRVALLRHHYRESWEYRSGDLDAAAVWVERLHGVARSAPDDEAPPHARIRAALEDDLDTPSALAALGDAVESREPGWRSGAELLGLSLGSGKTDETHAGEAGRREGRQA